eukprot:1797433-Prymnesium_polylepis.1
MAVHYVHDSRQTDSDTEFKIKFMYMLTFLIVRLRQKEIIASKAIRTCELSIVDAINNGDRSPYRWTTVCNLRRIALR